MCGREISLIADFCYKSGQAVTHNWISGFKLKIKIKVEIKLVKGVITIVSI
jgi:hypothetical protein